MSEVIQKAFGADAGGDTFRRDWLLQPCELALDLDPEAMLAESKGPDDASGGLGAT